MAGASDYLEDNILDHITGNATFSAPGTLYLALFTSDLADDGSGTEVSGSGYSRQTVAFGSSSSGLASNTGAVSFTATGGDFGEVTDVGIFDASSGGNLLFRGKLAPTREVLDGQTLTFAIGDVQIRMA